MSTTENPEGATNEMARDLEAEFDALAAKFGALTDELAELKEAKLNRERLFDVKALATRWGVSVRTVHNVVAGEYIKPTYINTSLRFSWDAIEAYEHGNTHWDKRQRTYRPVIRKKYNHATGVWEKPVC